MYLPAFDDGPAATEQWGRVDDETDSKSLRVVSTQQPDQVLHHLVVHTAQTEVLQVKHYTQVVHHLLETLLTRLFLQATGHSG